MDRIRRRVRLRRSRRAAAATALVAVAAVIGVVSGPRSLRAQPAASPTAATGPAVAHLLGADLSLRVELSEGWNAVSMQDVRGTSLAFISSQPLSRPAPGGCVASARQLLRTCRPVPRLAEGGVLIVLWPTDEPRRLTSGSVPLRMTDHAVDRCAGVGADGETTGYGNGRSASAGSFDVSITVCRRGATAKTAAAAALDFLHRTFPGDAA
ncbi:hypothetical protein AB0N06_23305 [Streptomyces sp. NPDC051020]|uniref:hypothetical protein n=1 Tax=Streptomyces sp. NPDC051020 TaxID=3155409 RepID=UPI00343AFDD2